MCGLYNKHHATDTAIYKTFLIQQPALKIKAIEHTGFFEPTAPLFCSQVTKLESRANFLCYNQYLAKVAGSFQL